MRTLPGHDDGTIRNLGDCPAVVATGLNDTRPTKVGACPWRFWLGRWLIILFAGICLGFPASQVVAQDYSGEWSSTPLVSYSCGTFGLPEIQFLFSSMTILDEYPNIRVTPGSVPNFDYMFGSFTSPTAFTVHLAMNGGCSVFYTLAGEFVSATEFTATFTVNFTGVGCGFTNCVNQSWDIIGTRPTPPCCAGSTGNVDCDLGNGIDISDLSRLVDFLYVSFDPLCCEPSANVDGQAGIDISDLSALVDYLYVNFTPPSPCP